MILVLNYVQDDNSSIAICSKLSTSSLDISARIFANFGPKFWSKNIQYSNSNVSRKLIDFCFELVNNPSTKIASRVFAAKIIEKQVKHYPELIPELKQMLEFHYENASGGFKACIKNILKKL